MATLYTNTAIALMARERLLQIRNALQGKVNNADPGAVTDLEKKVLYLADRAFTMMNSSPPLPARSFPGASSILPAHTMSRYFVLGAVGTSFPAFASLFADGQSWLVDTLHKGNPDTDRERVVAKPFSFVFELWRQVQPLISSSGVSDSIKELRLSKMRSYVLGHLCAVAGEVLTGPYIDDVAWHMGTANRTKRFRRDEVIGKLDDEVKRKVLLPSIPDPDPDLASWWPAAGDVPSQFYEAFARAFQEVYLREGRPHGLAEFEERFARYPAQPAFGADLIADGYKSFRGILATGYDWGFWKWFGVLSGVFLPTLLTVPLFAALPVGGRIYDEHLPADDKEKAWFQVIGLQYAVTAVVPPLYALFIGATTSKGFTSETITGLVLGLVNLVPAAFYFVSLDSDFATGVRWGLLLALPAVVELVYIFYIFLFRGGGEKYNRLLAWTFILHGGMALLGTAFIAIQPFGKWLLKGPGEGEWWGAMVILSAVVFGVWAFFSWVLTKRFVNPIPDERFPVDQAHFVRLFDDASLYHMPDVLEPTLADLHYPSGRRKLLKLWWAGEGDMHVRPRRNRLEFRVDPAAAPTTLVLAPLAPTTLKELADYLPRAVPGLGVVVAYDSDLEYALQPGEVFADHGDDEASTTEQQHDANAGPFRQLGTANDDDAYVLYHVPKGRQAVRFGSRGPAPLEAERPATAAGPGNVATDPAPVAVGTNGVLGSGGTTFWTFFRIGDAIQIGANPRRVVASVDSDTQLTTVLPLPGLPAAAGPAVGYQRIVEDRSIDSAVLGTVQIVPLFPAPAAFVPTDVLSSVAGPDFGESFLPGDLIRILPGGGLAPQTRKVKVVFGLSPTVQLTTDMPFTPAVGAGLVSYLRVGSEARDGYSFVSGPEVDIAGESIMDLAADLAALLCLGGASHLLDPQQRRPGAPGYPGPGELTKVVQVFRDWNLDRRRLNEWRMLVSGHAVSEKRGAPAGADPAMLAPEPGWSLLAPNGEKTALQLGWVPLLRKWIEMARRPGVRANEQRSFRPGDPTNLELSQAMAFLLDMPEPTPAP